MKNSFLVTHIFDVRIVYLSRKMRGGGKKVTFLLLLFVVFHDKQSIDRR